jgi:hypothetical protein
MTMRFGNVVSVNSTYLKLHIWIKNLLNYAYICELQQQDKQLLALQVQYPDNYVNLQLDDNINDIICYKKEPTQPNWNIALPKSMVVDTVKRFHQVMGHPGKKRLRETLNQRYHHPKLCYHINRLKCKDCQKYKVAGGGYGLLPNLGWEIRSEFRGILQLIRFRTF